ncbi:unnamed protein product [Urochloa humidicola]
MAVVVVRDVDCNTLLRISYNPISTPDCGSIG